MSDAFAPVLQAFLTRLPLPEEGEAARIEPVAHLDPVINELVYSLLLWEASPASARDAHHRMVGAFVDLNELRICMPDELIALLGSRYPRAEERAIRLKMALNDIFRLEHGMSLARLQDIPKRDARQFLSELPSVPGFVASRVCLIALGAHAFPVDERLRGTLIGEGACDAEHNTDQCAVWLERQLRAGEACVAYLKLEHWLTTQPQAISKSTGKGSSKNTTNKAGTGTAKKSTPKKMT